VTSSWIRLAQVRKCQPSLPRGIEMVNIPILRTWACDHRRSGVFNRMAASKHRTPFLRPRSKMSGHAIGDTRDFLDNTRRLKREVGFAGLEGEELKPSWNTRVAREWETRSRWWEKRSGCWMRRRVEDLGPETVTGTSPLAVCREEMLRSASSGGPWRLAGSSL
jgi:hypothetical protein